MDIGHNKDAYDKMAIKYAITEWSNYSTASEDICSRLIPYVSEGRILIAGSSAGRDTQYFINKGYNVMSVDYSLGLIQEAEKRVDATFIHADITQLDHYFDAQQYDGIYCGSALQHLNEPGLSKALGVFNYLLTEKGHGLIGLKEGNPGEIYETEDFGEKRTYLFHSEDEIKELLTNTGFVIDEVFRNEHFDDKPSWINFIFSKPTD